jgi:hypothetical protein
MEQLKKFASKAQLRNLYQNRNMTDEEFEIYYEKYSSGIKDNSEFEARIKRKIEEFNVDYDIEDLKINDILTIRALAQAIISLEDMEHFSYNLRSEGISENTIYLQKEVSKMMTDLRSDISKMQDDLGIARKARKGDKEQSVINYIKDLKEKARLFYESKMQYIFCTDCGMLLGTVWALYPDEKRNSISLICNRIKEDGTLCGTKVRIDIKDLFENGGSNRNELMPEALK